MVTFKDFKKGHELKKLAVSFSAGFLAQLLIFLCVVLLF